MHAYLRVFFLFLDLTAPCPVARIALYAEFVLEIVPRFYNIFYASCFLLSLVRVVMALKVF